MISLYDYEYGEDEMGWTEEPITKGEAQIYLLDAEDLVSTVVNNAQLIRKVENFHALKVIQEELHRIRKEEFSHGT